jgi:hypothetical protein
MFGKNLFGKKKKKLFGDGIEPRCEYCANFSEKGSCCFGEKDPSCGRFQYDPLKRTPVCPPPLKKHSPDEFTL